MLIPTNYWSGAKTLEAEYPWLTPHSIFYLESVLNTSQSVLEFGSGGSTLFFSHRTKEVLSFETDEKWFHQVKHSLAEKRITNVEIFLIKNLEEVVLNRSFDIILIDSADKHIPRPDVVKLVVSFVNSGGIVILDNYSRYSMDKFFEGYEIKIFDDLHWAGKGTKLYIKP